MIVLLRNFDRYGAYVLFDESRKQILQRVTPSNFKMGDVQGYVGCCGTKAIILYRTDKLWLLIDDCCIPFDERVVVELARMGRIPLARPRVMDKMFMTVKVEAEIIASWDYAQVQWDLEFDPTIAEEEDFDFGIFLKNLADDGDRRHRIFSMVGQ